MSIYATPFPSFFPIPAVEHVETLFSPAVQHVETPYSATADETNEESIAAIRHIIRVDGMRLRNEWYHYIMGRRQEQEEEIVENATNISNLDLSDILSPFDDNNDHYIIEDDEENFDFLFGEY